MVKLSNGTTGRHHQDQLKSCQEQLTTPPDQFSDTVPPDLLTAPSVSNSSNHTSLRTVLQVFLIVTLREHAILQLIISILLIRMLTIN